MSQSDGFAVHIDLLHIRMKLIQHGNGLGCESFIGFNEVHIVDGEVCFLQCFLSGWDRSQPMILGSTPALADALMVTSGFR